MKPQSASRQRPTYALLLALAVLANLLLFWLNTHRPAPPHPARPGGTAVTRPAPFFVQTPTETAEASPAPSRSALWPVPTPRTPLGGEYMDVAWLPPYVFATGGMEALSAWRLDTPSRPAGTIRLAPVVGSIVPGRGFRIARVDASTLAISGPAEGVSLLDVSDPARPAMLGRTALPAAGAEGMAMAGSRLLVAFFRAGLAAVDLRDRRAPLIEQVLGELPQAHDVAVRGETAYVADGTRGLAVVSLGPGKMRLRGRAATRGDARRVAVDGTRVYLAMGSAGLDVVDVADPARPRAVAHVASPDPIFAVTVHDGFLYASAWSDLAVYRLSATAPPRLVSRDSLDYGSPPPLYTATAVRGSWLVASEWHSLAVAWHDRSATSTVPAAGTPGIDPSASRGATAPDFHLPDLQGRPRRLSEFRGKTVLLAFFAPY